MVLNNVLMVYIFNILICFELFCSVGDYSVVGSFLYYCFDFYLCDGE